VPAASRPALELALERQALGYTLFCKKGTFILEISEQPFMFYSVPHRWLGFGTIGIKAELVGRSHVAGSYYVVHVMTVLAALDQILRPNGTTPAASES
jgi:hypothetical protein